MSDPNSCAQFLSEKKILEDSLISQKLLTSSYNTYAGECVSAQLRSTMLNILDEEHKIQADLFSAMQSHGWYTNEPAQQQKITEARQRLSAQG